MRRAFKGEMTKVKKEVVTTTDSNLSMAQRQMDAVSSVGGIDEQVT